MLSLNDKFQIFDHVADTYLYFAQKAGFRYGDKENKYAISAYPNPAFNFLYLNKKDELLGNIIAENIPFMCFPQKELESEMEKIAGKAGLTYADNVVAHRFDISDSWKYEPSSNIPIGKVQTLSDLEKFDEISSECFGCESGLTYDFLKDVALRDDKCHLFFASYNGEVAATAMISFVNDLAGIYWLCVRPEFRNKSIATELSKYVINHAKENGFDSVISQNLTPSQSLFQKIGFRPVGELKLYMYNC